MFSAYGLPKFGGRAFDTFNDFVARRFLPNALIIQCEDESAGERIARYLCAAVACGSDISPCMTCNSCRKVLNKLSQDIIDVCPEDGKQSVSVLQIRDVRLDAYIIPDELDIKVYIIHSSEKMNIQSQNALLKILEEPPRAARFIFLCRNSAALLPTVRSRCVQIIVVPEKDEIKSSGSAAERTVEILINGSRADFESFLSSNLPDDRNEYRSYIRELLSVLRDIFAVKSGYGETVILDTDVCRSIARSISQGSVLKAYDCVYDIMLENDANTNTVLSQSLMIGGLWRSVHG